LLEIRFTNYQCFTRWIQACGKLIFDRWLQPFGNCRNVEYHRGNLKVTIIKGSQFIKRELIKNWLSESLTTTYQSVNAIQKDIEMQNPEEDKLKRLLQDTFSDYEPEPSEQTWEYIDASIHPHQPFSAKFAKRLAVAAIALLS
jgi:hypothetical protein